MSDANRFRILVQRALATKEGATEADPHLLQLFAGVWKAMHPHSKPHENDEKLWRRIVAEETGRRARPSRGPRERKSNPNQRPLFGGEEGRNE